MSGVPHLLFVDDEIAVQKAFARSISGMNVVVQCVPGVTTAIAAMKTRDFAVVVTDMTMIDGTGVDVLKAMETYAPHASRLVLSGDLDIANVLTGVAIDVVMNKPWDVAKLRKVVTDALALAVSRATAR